MRTACLQILICFINPLLVSGQFFVNGEQVFNSDTIGVYQSQVQLNNFALNNIGHIKIQAEQNIPAIINLNQTPENNEYLGCGSFELEGEQTFDLVFNRVFRFGHINFNNGTEDCWISDKGFNADSSITLNSSRVIIERNESYIKLNNERIDALVYDRTPNTGTYIIGRLVRNLSGIGRYDFPVGNENNVFLISTESFNGESTNVGVRFNDQLVSDWLEGNSTYKTTSNIQSEGGWEIDNSFSKSENSPLNLTVYKCSFPNLSNDGAYRIAYFDKDQYPYTEPVISEKELTVNTSELVCANYQSPTGYYALALSEEFDANVIPNFIVSADGHNYYFEIPGVNDMLLASLEVFNRWGQKVYEERNYSNQLDTKTLPKGTYYYVFKYDIGEGVKTLQSFFEVYKHW